jgi:hypothetical protein
MAERAPEMRGPTVAQAEVENFLDAPIDDVGGFLRGVGEDADVGAVAAALDEYDADAQRVLTREEFSAREKFMERLPVGVKLRRRWVGGMKFLGGLVQTASDLGRELPSVPELAVDAVARVLGRSGSGAVDRGVNTLTNLPGAIANIVRSAAVQGVDLANEGGFVQLSKRDVESPVEARFEDRYNKYILRKGVQQMREEIAGGTKLPGVEMVGGMALDPANVLPFGGGLRGGSVTGQISRRLAGAAGTAVEVPAGAVAAGIGAAEGAVQRRLAAAGLTPEMGTTAKWLGGMAATGVAGFGLTNDNDAALAASALLGLPAGMSSTKWVARILQNAGGAVRRGAGESLSATGMGVRETARELAGDVTIPRAYRDAMLGGRPVDSPLRRAAVDKNLPVMTRRLAATMDASGVPRLLEGAAGMAGSAVDGAFLGVAMSLAQTDEEQGGALAAGALFGVMGRVANKLSGAARREMQNGDIARMYAEVAADGGNYQLFNGMGHDDLASIAAMQGVFGRNVKLSPLAGEDFQNAMVSAGLPDTGRAVYISNPGGVQAGEVLVNMDRLRGEGPHVFAHEYAHALQNSDVLDGAIREDIRNWVDESFKPAELAAARVRYAAKLAGSDASVDVARAAARLDGEDVANGRMPGDWVRDELWAETFAGSRRGIDFWGARGRPQMLRGLGRSLAGLGVPVDPSTGRVMVESPVFGKLRTEWKGSVLERRLNDYVRGYARWIGGADAKAEGAKIFVDGVPRPGRFVQLHEVQPGVRENQFMREVDGRVSVKDQREIDAEFESRRKTFENMRKTAKPANAPGEWGVHRAPDGSSRVGGAELPVRFQQQPNIGPGMKAVEAELAAGQRGGASVRVVYHKIGSKTARGYRVKDLGNVRAEVMEVMPFWRSITKKDNILVHVVDVEQFRRNAVKRMNRGELAEFGNDMAVLDRAFKQYLQNHRDGLPGETGIGVTQRNVINELLGIGTNENRRANPLAAVVGGSPAKSAVKTLRLDRLEIARPGNAGMAFDYNKANANLMVDAGKGNINFMPEEVNARTAAKSGDNKRKFIPASTSVIEAIKDIARSWEPDLSTDYLTWGERQGGGWNRKRGMSNNAAYAIDEGKIMDPDFPGWIAETLGIPAGAVTQKAARRANVDAGNIFLEYHHVGRRGRVEFHAPEQLLLQPKFWLSLEKALKRPSHKAAARRQALWALQDMRQQLIESGKLGTWSTAAEHKNDSSNLDAIDYPLRKQIQNGEIGFREGVLKDFENRMVWWNETLQFANNLIARGKKVHASKRKVEVIEREIAAHPAVRLFKANPETISSLGVAGIKTGPEATADKSNVSDEQTGNGSALTGASEGQSGAVVNEKAFHAADRADNGKLIPLSRRFDSGKGNINFMPDEVNARHVDLDERAKAGTMLRSPQEKPQRGTLAMNNVNNRSHPRAYALESAKKFTPEFKQWFEGSKIITPNGKPRLVYHKTAHDFEAFGSDTGRHRMQELGFHFGTLRAANEVPREGGFLIKAYLQMKNPLRISDPGFFIESYDLLDAIEERGIAIPRQSILAGSVSLIEELESYGYDGFVYRNHSEGGGADSFAVFHPEQIWIAEKEKSQ